MTVLNRPVNIFFFISCSTKPWLFWFSVQLICLLAIIHDYIAIKLWQKSSLRSMCLHILFKVAIKLRVKCFILPHQFLCIQGFPEGMEISSKWLHWCSLWGEIVWPRWFSGVRNNANTHGVVPVLAWMLAEPCSFSARVASDKDTRGWQCWGSGSWCWQELSASGLSWMFSVSYFIIKNISMTYGKFASVCCQQY